MQLIVFELRNRNRQFKLFGSPHSQTFVSTFLFGCCMNFVVAISVTYSYILSIGLQDKIGILVNQVFKVEREIPEKQTKSKTVIYISQQLNMFFFIVNSIQRSSTLSRFEEVLLL